MSQRRRLRPFTGLAVLRRGRSECPAPEDPWFHGRPLNRSRAAAGLVWLGFIAAPMVDAIGHGGHGAGYVLTIAAAVAFLASDDASFVNGVNLPVDGGVSASNGQPKLG